MRRIYPVLSDPEDVYRRAANTNGDRACFHRSFSDPALDGEADFLLDYKASPRAAYTIPAFFPSKSVLSAVLLSDSSSLSVMSGWIGFSPDPLAFPKRLVAVLPTLLHLPRFVRHFRNTIDFR